MNSSTEKDRQPRISQFHENLNVLQEIPFFSRFPLEALKVFAYLGVREVYEAGETLFQQNDNDGQAFYIVSGKARLSRENEHGETFYKELGAGEFMGALALMGDMYRLFSLKAVDKMTCMVLRREKFTRAVEQYPDLVPKLLEAVNRAVRDWEERFVMDFAERCESCREGVGVSLV